MVDDGSTPPALEWHVEGNRVAYPDAIEAMTGRVAAIRAGLAPERIWLLEHPPLYTAGTSAKPEDLAKPGFLPTFATGRGGQWTYHGPGQRIAYVMLDLTRRHGTVPPRDLHLYVTGLEAWLMAALARFGVAGERRAGRVGIWVTGADGTECKIAALGVRVTRWVSWHGVSINVNPDLAHFGGIVPCGIREHGVTSLEALGISASMEEVDTALLLAWSETFGDAPQLSASTMNRAASAMS